MDISTPEGLIEAVRWQTNHVSRIREGGVWLVPRSGTVITIYHSKKHAKFFGMLPEPDIQKVFRAMGWTVDVVC